MARLFDDTASDVLSVSAAVVTAAPLTFAAWYYPDDLAVDGTLVTVADASASNHYHQLVCRGTLAGDPVSMKSRDASATTTASSSAGASGTTNAWYHACGIVRGAADRSAYFNGGNRGNNTASATPTGLDTTGIGATRDSSPAEYMSGRIAHVTIWNAALDDREVTALATGINPFRVRPANVVGYWPLWGLHSPDIDLTASGNNMTVTGTALADDAPVALLNSAILRTNIAGEIAAGGGGAVPVKWDSMYRRRRAVVFG